MNKNIKLVVAFLVTANVFAAQSASSTGFVSSVTGAVSNVASGAWDYTKSAGNGTWGLLKDLTVGRFDASKYVVTNDGKTSFKKTELLKTALVVAGVYYAVKQAYKQYRDKQEEDVEEYV